MTSCKPIKFFLRLGDLQVHDLQELRDVFHLDLVHELYTHGILARWLDVHGYTDVHAALLEYQQKYQDQELDDKRAYAFCTIFFPEAMPADLGDIVENFKLRAKWRAECKAMVEKKDKWQTDIVKYHKGYVELKQAIVDKAYDMPAIKACLLDMSCNYYRLFALDVISCLGLFREKAPVALLLMLANPVIRNFFAAYPERWKRHVKILRAMIPLRPGDNKLLSPFIFPQEEDAEKQIVSLVKATNKYTQKMWDDIEPHGNKKYMILLASPKNTIRPCNVSGGELKPEELDEFPIIDGIYYRSRDASEYLVYMEV